MNPDEGIKKLADLIMGPPSIICEKNTMTWRESCKKRLIHLHSSSKRLREGHGELSQASLFSPRKLLECVYTLVRHF